MSATQKASIVTLDDAISVFFFWIRECKKPNSKLETVFFSADDLLARWFWSGEIYREEDE